MKDLRKIVLTGLFAALGVVLSAFYIPTGLAKCYPIQSLLNVLAAVMLGPAYAVAMAFITSLLRVMLGTGSFLAFPGSMIGALCSGLLYHRFHKLSAAYLGEVAGTGILGALAAYPVAAYLLSAPAALFTYVLPFMVSSLIGSAISVVLLKILERTKLFDLAHSHHF
ncbi:energy coupling factor transporter S component ThiW [Caproicibacter sp.]|uniref:energy coupling factor transporter S component ThiW n=1 Tax=Caproicibacter sp. TaxID=2814884 RepID=UPI003989D5A1